MTTGRNDTDSTATIRVALSEIRLKEAGKEAHGSLDVKENARQSVVPVLGAESHVEVVSSKWIFSPRGPLKQAECKCQNPKRKPHEAPIDVAADLIDYGLACFERVWHNVTGVGVPRVVADAVLRALYQLRQEGHEMLHIAAKDVRQDTKRTDLSVVFLVPSNDKANGWHRWVAEVLVHRYAVGQHQGKVENVATRFASDWTDWTISFPRQIYDDELEADFVVDLQDAGMGLTGHKVVRAVAEQTSRCLDIDAKDAQKGLRRRIASVTEWVNRQEQHVSALVVKKRYLKSESGRRAYPCVTISIYAQDQDGAGGGDQQNGDDIAKGADKANGEDRHVFSTAGKTAAVVIVIEGQKDGQGTKPLMVMYDGEWPIAHQYRSRFPPPDLSSLGEMAIAAEDALHRSERQ